MDDSFVVLEPFCFLRVCMKIISRSNNSGHRNSNQKGYSNYFGGLPIDIIYHIMKANFDVYLCTVPIDKVLSVKNARAWVSMVSYLNK